MISLRVGVTKFTWDLVGDPQRDFARRMDLIRYVICLLVACAVTLAAPPPPSTPIARAKDALNGLLHYFSRVESSASIVPQASGCPCYSCDGTLCDVPQCIYCSAKVDDPCPTKSTPGCYTSKSAACTCNRPPGPVPPNASSPAAFFFACGQIGGLGSGGAYSSCTCEIDWPFACTNCYRWWSAIALESAVNFVIESKMPLNDSLAARIVFIAESTWIHSPYNSAWVRNKGGPPPNALNFLFRMRLKPISTSTTSSGTPSPICAFTI